MISKNKGSTGVCWISAFNILDARGFDVVLVNARDANDVPGRKTDVNDAQVDASAPPRADGGARGAARTREIDSLRAYLRHRKRLVE